MGVLTSGLITVTPVRIHTELTLGKLRSLSMEPAARYNPHADKASHGWGGPDDDDFALGLPVTAALDVGAPQLVEARDGVPSRLRLRYYWDEPSPQVLRSLGAAANWRSWHVRRAVDLVVFADRAGSYSAVISTRDARVLKAHPLRALRDLVGEETEQDGGGNGGGRVESDGLPESLPHDFFSWLLYKLNGDGVIGRDVALQAVNELSSRDRLLRGARFTDTATLDRIELAALITMGDHRFGPAKIGIEVKDLDAAFDLELHLDGGFKVYRTSSYDSRQVADVDQGHELVEDYWSVVAPRLRAAYANDTTWTSRGRAQLRDGAISLIRRILPPEPA